MSSKTRALIWEVLMEQRAALLLLGSIFAVYSVLIYVLEHVKQDLFQRGAGEFFMWVPWICLMGILLFLLTHASGQGIQLSFPRRHFVTPVSTGTLVSVQLLCKLLVLLPFTLLFTYMGTRLDAWGYNTLPLVWGPAFFLSIAAWAFALSCIANISRVAVVLCGILLSIPAFGFLVLVDPFYTRQHLESILTSPQMCILASILIAGAWLIAYAATWYARRGGSLPIAALGALRPTRSKPPAKRAQAGVLRIWLPWTRFAALILYNKGTFESADDAQYWFEWRRCGRYVLWCVLPLVLAATAIVIRKPNGSVFFFGYTLPCSILFCTAVIGGYLLACNKRYLGFVATKPLSTSLLASARTSVSVTASLAVSVLFWSIFLVLIIVYDLSEELRTQIALELFGVYRLPRLSGVFQMVDPLIVLVAALFIFQSLLNYISLTLGRLILALIIFVQVPGLLLLSLLEPLLIQYGFDRWLIRNDTLVGTTFVAVCVGGYVALMAGIYLGGRVRKTWIVLASLLAAALGLSFLELLLYLQYGKPFPMSYEIAAFLFVDFIIAPLCTTPFFVFAGIAWRCQLIDLTRIRSLTIGLIAAYITIRLASGPIGLIPEIPPPLAAFAVSLCFVPFAWVPLVTHFQRHR